MDERGNRRDVILEKAAELFATRGVSATTVRQIADQVGMLSGSLYHHFASKDLIAEEIVINYLDDVRDRYRALRRSDRPAIVLLREVVQTSFSAADDHPYAVQIYQNETTFLSTVPRYEHIEKAAQEIHRFWADIINAGVASGEFRSDVNPRLFHRLLRDAVWLSPRWYKPTKQYPPDSLAQDVLTVFLDGFATEKVTGGAGATARQVAAAIR